METINPHHTEIQSAFDNMTIWNNLIAWDPHNVEPDLQKQRMKAEEYYTDLLRKLRA
jgi:hypothetical protein